MQASEQTVLVVEPDDVVRDEIGGWLEEEGFTVLSCPGPTGPDYTCPAGRGRTCPLATGADAVVLDLRQRSDVEHTGTPGFELLFYYGALDKPIVLLSGQEDPVRPLDGPGVQVLERRPTRKQLVTDVLGALTERSRNARPGEPSIVEDR
jgi:CheY-like chemotaxis protein